MDRGQGFTQQLLRSSCHSRSNPRDHPWFPHFPHPHGLSLSKSCHVFPGPTGELGSALTSLLESSSLLFADLHSMLLYGQLDIHHSELFTPWKLVNSAPSTPQPVIKHLPIHCCLNLSTCFHFHFYQFSPNHFHLS
jgi:hypothetical protein